MTPGMVCQNCGSERVGADGVCANCGWSADTAASAYGTKPVQTVGANDLGATRESTAFPRGPRPGMNLPGTNVAGGNPGQGLLSRSAASGPSGPSTPSAPRVDTPDLMADDDLDEVPPEDEIEDFCGNCGAPIQHGRTFCGKCGAPVTRGGVGQTTASSRHVAYDIPPPWRPEDREAPTQLDIQASGGAAQAATGLTPQQRAIRIGLGILCLLGSLVTAVLAILQLVSAVGGK